VQLSDRIGRRLKLQDLHVLMAVIQAGTMGKAAQTLNTSQPAISRSIAELEHTLGVHLLDRSRQGIEPTKYGRALLDCGAAVFDDLRRGVKNIEFLADPTAGEVRIGTIHALAPTFVSAAIEQLALRHPRIVFHLVAAELIELYRELNERNIDLLIVQKFDLFRDEQLDFEPLYNSSYVVVAGAKNQWTRRRRLRLSELMNEPWVLPPPESVFGTIIANAFRAKGLEYPRATIFAAHADMRMALLKSGRFLSIFTTAVLGFPGKAPELRVLPVELPITGQAPVGIVTLKNRSLSPVAQLFIKHVREVAKPFKKGKS
jgi:DNA-binding transcriptional LysR family regulator